MQLIVLFLLILSTIIKAEELIVGNCAENTVVNQYGKFIQRFCDAYLNNKKVGVLKVEEHITPPFYGMVGGYLEIGNKIYKANYFIGKYFATYEPYGNGLKIKTMCGVSYSNSTSLKNVWKAMLDCFKERENRSEK